VCSSDLPADKQAVDKQEGASEAPLFLLLATWTAVALNFYFGLSAALPVELADSAARILMGHMR
jgi:hypothetical protein